MKQLYKIDVHGQSKTGRDHAVNHDHFAIATLNKSMRLHQTNLSVEDEARVDGDNQGHVFLVADGVSGGPAPAKASRTAVDSVVRYFLNEMPWYHLAEGDAVDVRLALEDALWNCQQVLQVHGDGDNGMGTTLTLAFVSWPDLFVAHVGDSKCYLSRAGELSQLTTDHTLAQVRRDLPGGQPTGADSDILWNAVGGRSEDLAPEVLHYELEPRDVLALVTDGVEADGLPDLLAREAAAEQLCGQLVDGPARDDSTAIVARFLPAENSRAAGPSDPAPPRLTAHVHKPGYLPPDDIEPRERTGDRRQDPRRTVREPARRVSVGVGA